ATGARAARTRTSGVWATTRARAYRSRTPWDWTWTCPWTCARASTATWTASAASARLSLVPTRLTDSHAGVAFHIVSIRGHGHRALNLPAARIVVVTHQGAL